MKNSTAPSRFEQGAMACTSGPITVRIIVNGNCGWWRFGNGPRSRSCCPHSGGHILAFVVKNAGASDRLCWLVGAERLSRHPPTAWTLWIVTTVDSASPAFFVALDAALPLSVPGLCYDWLSLR